MLALRPVQGAHLLLVEDNEINQQVACELLEHARFKITVANHGQEALDMLEPGRFDCVLMDVLMPIMDGLTATRHIRQDSRFDNLPVLAMTANATLEDRERCRQAGMNDHIAKPIAPKTLFETLLKWVEHKDRELPQPSDSDTTLDPQEAELPQLPGIDTAAGVARIGGNVRSYKKLLLKFAESHATTVDDIRAAYAAADKQLSVRLAHNLKGVGGAIGATDLQKAAAELETSLASEPEQLPEALIAAMSIELDRILDLLAGLAQTPVSDTASIAVIPTDLTPELHALMNLLEEDDSEAEESLEEIIPKLLGTTLQPALQALHKQVSQYDFESAVESLKSIIEEYKTLIDA